MNDDDVDASSFWGGQITLIGYDCLDGHSRMGPDEGSKELDV